MAAPRPHTASQRPMCALGGLDLGHVHPFFMVLITVFIIFAYVSLVFQGFIMVLSAKSRPYH